MLLHVLYIVPILLDHMTKVGVVYVDRMNDDGAGIVSCHW